MTVDSGIRHDESFYVIANSSNITVYFKDVDYYSGKRRHKKRAYEDSRAEAE